MRIFNNQATVWKHRLKWVCKLILARWRSEPIQYRVRERQPITGRLRRISLKSHLKLLIDFSIFILAIHTVLFFAVFYKIDCDDLIAIHSVQFALSIILIPMELFHLKFKLWDVTVWLNVCCYVTSLLSGAFWYWPQSLRSCNCEQHSARVRNHTKSWSRTGFNCDDNEVMLIMVSGTLRSVNSLSVGRVFMCVDLNVLIGEYTNQLEHLNENQWK